MLDKGMISLKQAAGPTTCLPYLRSHSSTSHVIEQGNRSKERQSRLQYAIGKLGRDGPVSRNTGETLCQILAA